MVKLEKMTGLVLAVAVASASAANGFNVEVLAPEDPTGDYLFAAGLLLFLTVVVGLWSISSTSVLRRVLKGPKAENLFLSVSLQSEAEAKDPIKGHLRQLDLHTAKVVSHTFLPKGTDVILNLSSLPEFQGTSDVIKTKVLHCEVVRGKPPSYILTLRWGDLPQQSQSELTQYIGQLVGNPRRQLSAG